MVLDCSELREALAKVSSSTKTAFLRSRLWRDSKFEDISIRLPMAPLHLSSLPFIFCFSLSFSCSIFETFNFAYFAVSPLSICEKQAPIDFHWVILWLVIVTPALLYISRPTNTIYFNTYCIRILNYLKR